MPNLSRWFLPADVDVLGMLCEQAKVTIAGMEELAAWAAGDASAADRLRAAEHTADQHKRALRIALRDAFITPIGAEDMYVMSERLDAVINGAKDAVREAEVMAIPTNKALAEMAVLLREGVAHLAIAFERLGRRGRVVPGEEATDEADAAVKSQRQLERAYRMAMSDLLSIKDLREVMSRRELYRRFSRISEDITEVAERVWYASVKEA